MVKKEKKKLIFRIAGGKHITPTLPVFLLALKAFSSFLKDHVFFSIQGWFMMQDNSVMHPMSVTDTHRCILPRPTATWTPGFRGACPTQQLVWVHVTPRFGCWHAGETLTHGSCDQWLQHSDTPTQTCSQSRNGLTEGMTSTPQSWRLSFHRLGSSRGKVLFLWLGNWGFPHRLFCLLWNA